MIVSVRRTALLTSLRARRTPWRDGTRDEGIVGRTGGAVAA
jgi:hypothetical protein